MVTRNSTGSMLRAEKRARGVLKCVIADECEAEVLRHAKPDQAAAVLAFHSGALSAVVESLLGELYPRDVWLDIARELNEVMVMRSQELPEVSHD